jgi:hypothetical protein
MKGGGKENNREKSRQKIKNKGENIKSLCVDIS